MLKGLIWDYSSNVIQLPNGFWGARAFYLKDRFTFTESGLTLSALHPIYIAAHPDLAKVFTYVHLQPRFYMVIVRL